MKTTVYFTDKQKRYKIGFKTKHLIKKAIKLTLIHENFPHNAELSVTFVNNKHIHKLNREYRGKDRATDVLSFPMWDDGFYGEVDLATKSVTLGDIVISAERAMEQANEYGHSIFREVCFLAVHSTLHLLGYDHETSEEDELYMNLTQEAVLSSMGLKRE